MAISFLKISAEEPYTSQNVTFDKLFLMIY